MEQVIQGVGVPFIPYCEELFPSGRLAQGLEQLAKRHGQEAIEFTFRFMAELLAASFIDLPRVLRERGFKALVLDEAMLNMGLVPMKMDIPFVHLSNALPFDFSGKTPLCMFGWPHETTPEALARNIEGVRQFTQIDKPRIEVGRAYAQAAGLDIDWSDPMATISTVAWLTQMPREFDFQGAEWPEQLHYTGPLHDRSGRTESKFPWEGLTGEPLIYASMGTLMNGLESVFSTIAEAVGDRRGAQLVLSIGPHLDPSLIQSVPASAVVVQHAPQIELLKRSILCITHAGLNTALESLTQGVPMVAIPVANDQFGVGARISETGTGIVVDLPGITAEKLSLAIDEVLDDPFYKQNVMRLKGAISREDGLDKAADLVENAFSVTNPEQVRSL